jgi:apolipoprotein N-acyltransferase
MIFPWYLGMTQHRFLPFIQIADLAGVAGVSALLVALNGAAYLALVQAGRRRDVRLLRAAAVGPREPTWTIAVVAGVVVAALAYGWVQVRRYEARRAAADKVPFGVVQPNIGIGEKRDPRLRREHLRLLQQLTAEVEGQGALVAVWPESAYPAALPHEAPPGEGGGRRDFADGHPFRIRRGFTIPLVFGSTTRGRDPPRTYNSAFLLDAEGGLHGPVDKNVLLMFGEYIPLRDWLGFLDRWFPRTGSLAAGTEPELLPLGNLTLGLLNCYEDILPRYVSRLMRAGEPNVLVNVTNDAWFGDSAEPHQHLALAVFRCVEQRREMVRAVNTGVSAHVAATGEILHRTPTFRRAAFVAPVVPYAGRTIYGTIGDAPGYAALVLLLGWALWRRHTAKRPRPAVP